MEVVGCIVAILFHSEAACTATLLDQSINLLLADFEDRESAFSLFRMRSYDLHVERCELLAEIACFEIRLKFILPHLHPVVRGYALLLRTMGVKDRVNSLVELILNILAPIRHS